MKALFSTYIRKIRCFTYCGAVIALLCPFNQATATIVAGDDFNYAAGNLSGENGGIGFSGAWIRQNSAASGTFVVQTTALTMNGVIATGHSAVFTSNSVYSPVTYSRTLSQPLTGTYYTSYLFSINGISGVNPVAGLASGQATDSDSTAAFFWGADAFASMNPGARANGSAYLPGDGLSLVNGATYLCLSYTNTASQTTTEWVLTSAQLNNFLRSSTLDAADLNAASIGSAPTNVFFKQTATASGTIDKQSCLILFGYNASWTGYSFTVGEVRISNASLLESITALLRPLTPTVYVPTYNPNEAVVAMATPQQFGARGDGVTDDTAAFQAAINAIQNLGHRSGGVLYVPADKYYFSGSLNIPPGVTLHGDWTNWTTGTGGAVGTIFEVTANAQTAPSSSAASFITMQGSSGVKGITFWYPNQVTNANPIPYPSTIYQNGATEIQNIIFVNSYEGVSAYNVSHATESSVYGTPLSVGILINGGGDISYMEDITFSPNAWALSGLPGAPSQNSGYTTYMRTSGTGLMMENGGGEFVDTVNISGYDVGISLSDPSSTTGCSITFDNATTSNCAMGVQTNTCVAQGGIQFTCSNISGDVGIGRNSSYTGLLFLQFDQCHIEGTVGDSVDETGSGGQWQFAGIFQDCTFDGTFDQEDGVFTLGNSTFNGDTPYIMGANAVRTSFVGCNLTAQDIVNNTSTSRLMIDPNKTIDYTCPSVNWAEMKTDYVRCKPAKNTLYVVTTGFGAVGDGVNDDTQAIQIALNTAGSHGGGIVYLPGGHYKTSGTLNVPSGVEMRGVYEMRHYCGSWPTDNLCKASVILPYSNQGPAITLQANSGIVGVDVNYETQNGQNQNPVVFPPTVQGQGANVYAIAMVSPNAYTMFDFDTYTCTNHFVYAADGAAIAMKAIIGNGSSGEILNCTDNPSYWAFIGDTSNPNKYNGNPSGPLCTYMLSNLVAYQLGDCNEIMMKDFSIFDHNLVHTVTEDNGSGQETGPNLTAIGVTCDASYLIYLLDGSGPANIQASNVLWCVADRDSGSNPPIANVMSTTSFDGTARFYDLAIIGMGSQNDFNIGGGDVGAEAVYLFTHSYNGSVVSGGAFHLVNSQAYISYETGQSNDFPLTNIAFQSDGISGIPSEIANCMSYSGYNITNAASSNIIDELNDFNVRNYTVYDEPWEQ